jgi:hypothetical protein
VSHSPVSIPDQPRCKHCGEIIPTSGRRPREFCCDAHRQADYRKRRREADAGSDVPLPPAGEYNSCTAESAKIGGENPNQINGPNFVTDGSSLPLDLFGRGHRWPGANGRSHARISAAVDTELGAGGLEVVSPGGVRFQIIPRRAR